MKMNHSMRTLAVGLCVALSTAAVMPMAFA